MSEKSRILPVLALSVLGAAPLAHALSTSRTYEVLVDGQPLGKLSFRNLVLEAGADRCRYTARWSGQFGSQSRTRVCKIDEYKAGDFFDCEANRRTFFPTVISSVKDRCDGFDLFGQATRIPIMVAGESPRGELFGVIMSSSIGDIQNLQITPVAAPSLSLPVWPSWPY